MASFCFYAKKNITQTVLLCILSVSLFFINQEGMICYVTACTTQHTENKKKGKQYNLNCTKQHWAINKPHTFLSHFWFKVFPLPNPRRRSISLTTAALRRWLSFFNLFEFGSSELCLEKCPGADFSKLATGKERWALGKLFAYNQPLGGCSWIK